MALAGDVPTLETLAAVALLRENIPALKIRVVNVVDLVTLQPSSEHPHGLNDRDFDSLFTTDKPIVFAFHGYPWLIHRLTYRRTNHDNLHVRGYKEEGTTTTPFDMAVLNELDCFHLPAMSSIAFQGYSAGVLTSSSICATSSSSTNNTSGVTATTCRRSATGNGRTEEALPRKSVILSEAKNLH
jgi:xylulose-5-phosphate/fructose-6-phosphate phosphoketolase